MPSAHCGSTGCLRKTVKRRPRRQKSRQQLRLPRRREDGMQTRRSTPNVEDICGGRSARTEPHVSSSSRRATRRLHLRRERHGKRGRLCPSRGVSLPKLEARLGDKCRRSGGDFASQAMRNSSRGDARRALFTRIAQLRVAFVLASRCRDNDSATSTAHARPPTSARTRRRVLGLAVFGVGLGEASGLRPLQYHECCCARLEARVRHRVAHALHLDVGLGEPS